MPQGRSTLLALALAASPAFSEELAFVTCQNDDALSVIDLAAGKERARWSLPGRPAGVAATAEAIFTVAADSKTVRRHDPATGEVTAQRVLDGGPIGIAFDKRRMRVFVSDWYNARIWVLDATDLTPTGTLKTGAAPAGLALSKDGRWLASADRDADQISLFDAKTLALRHRVTVGTRPFGLTFAPDGRLFVGNVGSDDVTVVDTASGETLATVPVGSRPYGVAFAQGRAFVSNQYADSISVIALDRLEPEALLDSGEYPEGIDATTDGRRIVVANWFENSVTIFDAGSLSVIRDVETCDGPRAFGVFVTGERE